MKKNYYGVRLITEKTVELYNFYVISSEGVSETHYELEAHYPHRVRKPTPRCVLK